MKSLFPKIATLKKGFLLTSIILFGIHGFTVFGQISREGDFKSYLNSQNLNSLKSYSEIDTVFLPFKNDSLKMKALIKKAESTQAFDVESYALNNLGIIYRNLSFYDKALTVHQKAEKIAREAKNIDLEVISLNMIGVVYRRKDLIKPALDYHKKALDIANATLPVTQQLKLSIAVSQNSMGNIYLTLKQYDLAAQQFEKSLIIEKEANNQLGLAINYQNLGFADEAQGNLDLALKNYKLSLDYNNQIDSEIGRVICYNSIGEVYIKQKKYNDAFVIIEKALKKALQLADQFYIASSYINLGWAQKELNLIKLSEENLKKGLVLSENYGFKTSIVDANNHLSDLYAIKGDYKTSLTYYKSAINLEKTITNERNMQYVSDIIIEYENELKNNQIKALASENEIVKTKLERNQRLFWYTLFGLIVVGGVVIAINRNRQLSNEKQILTLEQNMLRSQMNPHFIFNSLNSIKLYIINNEKENAVYYLNKFSKLIRKILIASTEKEMSLEEELETMQLYMNIENIRFSNEIDVTINVDKNINTASIKVPSLILQPFLENALWHGLSSKKENKQIILNVGKTSEDYVTITITDNGIGREESERINKDKILKRKSVGIDITKARLANFSKRYTNDYKLEIEDLYDNKGNASGTKIIVNIPTRENVLKTA